MSSPTLAQKLTAEAIGTAILVFIGAGSVPLTVFLTRAGGTRYGSAGLSTISFAFAFAIFAAVYSVGHISGCHINPAVTIALLATRKIDAATAGGYIVAQLVGAFIGAGLTLIILTGNDPVTLGLGAVSVNANAGLGDRLRGRGHRHRDPRVHGLRRRGRRQGARRVRRDRSSVSSSTGSSSSSARSPAPRSTRPARSARDPRPGHRRDDDTSTSSPSSTSSGPIVGGLVGAFMYEFIGHTRTATVPVPAVAEHAPRPLSPTPDRTRPDSQTRPGGPPWRPTHPAG